MLLTEYDALVPGGKSTLFALYEYATREPFSFLLIDLLRPSEDAFHMNVTTKLIPRESANQLGRCLHRVRAASCTGLREQSRRPCIYQPFGPS